MHSPLPSTTALEAGLIDDPNPSPTRLSRVHENVRVLLRNSRFSLPSTSAPTTAHEEHDPNPNPGLDQVGLNTGQPTSPAAPAPAGEPSPLNDETAATATLFPPPTELDATHPPPPSNYRDTIQRMAHASAHFNTRAVAALNHPDLSDPSLPTYWRYDLESGGKSEKARTSSGRKRGYYVRRRSGNEARFSEMLGAVFAGLMVAVVVGTFIVLSTTSSEKVTPTFNILFALGIILSAIVFAHALSRLLRSKSSGRLVQRRGQGPQRVQFLLDHSPSSSTSSSSSRSRHRHRHHRRHHHRRPIPIPILPAYNDPATSAPISSNSHNEEGSEVRPDSREARPTPAVQLEQQVRNSRVPLSSRGGEWNKDADGVPQPPPPAYGRWRGSVRVENPEAVVSAGPMWRVERVEGDARGRGDEGESAVVLEDGREEVSSVRPPSYVTRENTGPSETGMQARVDEVETEEVEPEMVQVRGIGVAV